MIAPPVAGFVDPGLPKQIRVTHSADGYEYAYIHSKSGAAAPHSKTRALDRAYQLRRRFGVRQCFCRFRCVQST